MSVLFLPPSAGAASVPDASETVKGIIRIATSAEATAGTDDLTSMTPAKVKSVVDAAVVGGVTYQGTFDASSPADLSNASKGDLYIISVAGSYQGQDWAVGDHLLINADMGGTLDPNKIDKVDNTDSVTSVAGRTGAVVLSTADISGLATVATSGAYSDLSGTPSLATVATTGAYSDLTGTPTLGTAAAEDVGTSAGNVVQLNGSAQLPAVDGSLLTDLPSDVRSITSNSSITIAAPTSPEFIAVRIQPVGVGQTVTLPATGAGVNGSTVMIANDNANYSVTVQSAGGSLYFRNISGSITLEPNQTLTVSAILGAWFVTDFNYLNLSVSSPANGEALVYNSTSGLWENNTVSASVAALDDIGDVDTTGVSTNNVLKYDGANWVDGSVAYSEVTGKPSFATIATTGDYSDLNDSVVLQQFNATATASAISSNALHVFRFYGAGGFTLTLSTATVTNGFALFNNISGSDVTVTGPTFRSNGEGTSGGTTSITVKAGERRLYYLEGLSLYLEANSTLIGNNGDVTISSPANGEALIYNSTSGDWENGTVSATVAALNDIGDVDTTGVSTNNVLKYDGANWVDGSVAYSEVTGTPTLGTAAALDVGTSANNVVQLNGSAQLPAVDGSQLTGISATVAALNDIGDVSAASPNGDDLLAYNSTSGDWETRAQATNTTVSTTSTAAAIDNKGVNTYSFISSSVTLTIPQATQLNGLAIFNNTASSTQQTISGSSVNFVVSGNLSVSSFTLEPGETRTFLVRAAGIFHEISADRLERQGDVNISSPVTGETLIYNSTSGDWENGSATIAALNDVGDVDTTGQAAEDLLKYDGANWVPIERFEVVTTVTTSTALTVPEMEQLVRTSGSGITLTLPNIASNSIPAGVRYQVKVTDSNSVTIAPNGSELLEGSNGSYSTSGAKESLTVVCDGAGWWFI